MATLEPSKNVYVGHRYVPKIMGEWSNANDYEGLSIVTYQGTSYTSKQRVPVGIDILNEEYWVVTGNYNAQVESYRDDVRTLESTVNKLTPELANVKARTHITPDDFTGADDAEKIQKAFDYAIGNNIETIELTRTYDITGKSIMYAPESYFPFVHIAFRGGRIIKNDGGFMFDSLADNMSRNAPIFIGTIFEGADNCYVFNGDKIIRQNMDHCTFKRIGLVKSSTYIQSVRLDTCETGQLGCDFISAKMSYDFNMINHKGESSTTGFALINIQTNKANDISFFGLRISNSLIEGFANNTPVILGAGYGLSVDGSYFEGNKTSIKFIKGVGTERLEGTIQSNVFGYTKSNYDIEFEGFTPALLYVYIERNTTNVSADKYLTNIANLYKDYGQNNFYGGGTFAPNNFELKKSTSLKTTQVNNGADNGISFEFKIPTKNQGNTYNLTSKQLLLNAQFNFGSNLHFSAHLTGIVTLDGYYDGTESSSMYSLHFDKLSERNTGGNTNGILENPSNYDYYFKETGTKTISPYASTITIVFNFPKGVYQTSNTNKASLRGLNDILFETFFDK